MTQQAPILVLGATGKTGRRVVERLTARNLPVRPGSRSANPPFDWEKPETWAPAVQGVESVYITFQPDLAVPGALEAIRGFSALAVSSGVKRLVLLSGRGEDEAQACEEIVKQAGAAWTIVRASWFNQNFNESFFLESILAGEIVLPVGDYPEAFIDAEDIADVVVAALTEDGHAGQVYELSGPRLLTFKEAVAEIAAAAGREVNFIDVTAPQYAAILKDAGLPDDYAGLINYLFALVIEGRNAYLTDGVQRALGRAPRDFADYARATAATGVWSTSAEPVNND